MSAASLASLREILRLAQVDDMRRGVDLVRAAQPLGQRLELFAVAGRQHQMGAFLGEGFGRRGADTLGGAGDQDALATQMKIHGFALLLGGVGCRGWVSTVRLSPGSSLTGQHCSAALHRGAVWSIAIPSNKSGRQTAKGIISMSKRRIPDSEILSYRFGSR